MCSEKMDSIEATKCLEEQPSKLLGHLPSHSRSGSQARIACDIAPVHLNNNTSLVSPLQSNKSANMDTKKPSPLLNSAVLTSEVLPSSSPAPHRKKQSAAIPEISKPNAGIPEITSDLRDKLNFRNTNGVMNGMKMGTTAVEIHHTAANLDKSSSQSITKYNKQSSVSVRSKILPAPLSNLTNTTLISNSISEESKSFALDTPPPPPPSFQDVPPLSPPHEPPPPPPCEEPGGYHFIKSVASRAIGADSPCSSKSSQDGGTGVCNGHTVSEATSNTSIAASSEFSISSERSTDSSFSGARARTRHTSNSSSLSTQPRSDLDLSLASDVILKTPEISVSPLPNNDDLQVEYVNYENETQMAAIMSLIQKDLSEPYSIYTYRYFIHNWPHLCFLVSIKVN